MNEDILKFLKDRYFLSSETCWDNVAKRVSIVYPDSYEYIRDCKFLPSSPTLMNANTKGERRGTLSSCFPMHIDDSIDGIFDALKEASLVTKMGGGIGYNFSNLRSSNEYVKSLNRKSSGPLPFINIFNSMLDGIQQGGARRGSGMAMLDIEHPQILDFIKAKIEGDVFDRFNFSIRVPNSFYKKLERSPDAVHMVMDKEGASFALKDENNKEVSVRQLWDMIITAAWKSAEPGIFNRDIAYERCTVINLNTHVLSNPCLLDTAWLLTIKGLRQLKSIDVGDVIWSREGWTTIVNKWYSGIQKVYEWETTAGSLPLTEPHNVMYNGKKIEVSKAEEIDIFTGFYKKRTKIIPELVMDGLVLGDGSVHRASNNLVYLNVGKKDIDYFESEIKDLFIKDRTQSFKTGWEVLTQISYKELVKTYNRTIPNRYMTLKNDELYSFLRGMFSANGSMCGDRVTYKAASFRIIKQLQCLLSSLGIRSYHTVNVSKKVRFKNGVYQCRQSYDLNITTDRDKFYESIGFLQKYKCNKLNKIIQNKKRNDKLSRTSYSINKKINLGEHKVYDIEVDNNSHTFWCNGFDISNCQEFTNIPYTACSLASILLSDLIKEDGTFDWEEFEKRIVMGTRYLDATLDINTFPIKKIKDITLLTRPIGLGFMGLAHLLFRLKFPYNSPKAIKFVKELTRYMTLRSMKESVMLAKEYGSTQIKEGHALGRAGAYDAFDYDTFMNANKRFFTTKKCRNVNIEKLQKDIKKYGIRNSSQTSIAPTGSISFIADCSSGIEPVFGLAYSRKIEVANHEYETVYITDPVFEEYLINNFDEKVKNKILKIVSDNKGSCQKCTEIPKTMRKVFLTAGELNPKEHLGILEVVANNISLSVSKTINLPADISKEMMEDIYLDAYNRGVIGVTIYRDGSRKGILSHTNGEDTIVVRHAPKRPKTLPCHVYRIQVKGEEWIVFVGLHKGHPYEVFAGKINLVNLPSKIEEGFVTRIKAGVYQFIYDNEILIKDIGKLFESGEQEALTRQISTNLRHGTPVDFIIDQLSKSNGTIIDFNKAILRALKRYMKEKDSKNKCPGCGTLLIYKEGCETCERCGWSKCL